MYIQDSTVKNYILKINVFILTIVMSLNLWQCASSGENLRKNDPVLYHKIINKTIYLLHTKKFGEIIYEITLNNDGTISGDMHKIISKGKTKVEWYYKNNKIQFEYNNGHGYIHFNYNNKKTYYYDPLIYKNNKNILMITIRNFPNKKRIKHNTYPCIIGKDNLNVLIDNEKNNIAKANELWNKADKTSIKSLCSYMVKQKKVFSNNNNEYPHQKEATSLLHSLLDKKVKLYIKKYYKRYYKYSNYTLNLQGQDKPIKFYELFRESVLKIDKETGTKREIKIQRNGSGFNLIVKSDFGFGMQLPNSMLPTFFFIFKPYQKKLNLIACKAVENGKVKRAGNCTLNLVLLTKNAIQYPKIENLDTKLLEKL